MSESESFIDEVSDEVRKDKLFKLFKRYGWVLVLVVVLIVAGTAYNEWNKSNQQAEAQLTGDLLSAAVQAKDASALETLASSGSEIAVVAELQRANLLESSGDISGALVALRIVASNPEIATVYSDLAWLKIIMLDADNMLADERVAAFERLMFAGAPYRLLAQEQRAMQYVRDGDVDSARTDLASIINDAEVTASLRSRAQQLLAALGGELPTEVANG